MSDHADLQPITGGTETVALTETAVPQMLATEEFVATTLRPGHPRAPESHGMIHAVQSLLYIIIVAIFIITFTVQPFRIPSESMDPTLLVGDFLLVAKQNFPTPVGSIPLPSTPIRRGGRHRLPLPRRSIDPPSQARHRPSGRPSPPPQDHVYIDGQPLDEPYAVYHASSPENFRDNFPRLGKPDPDVASAWWIQMHSLSTTANSPSRHTATSSLAITATTARTAATGLRPRLRDCRQAAADLLLRQLLSLS